MWVDLGIGRTCRHGAVVHSRTGWWGMRGLVSHPSTISSLPDLVPT